VQVIPQSHFKGHIEMVSVRNLDGATLIMKMDENAVLYNKASFCDGQHNFDVYQRYRGPRSNPIALKVLLGQAKVPILNNEKRGYMGCFFPQNFSLIMLDFV